MNNRFSVASYSFHGLYSIGAMNIIQYMETLRYRYNLLYADIWNGMLQSYDDEYLQLLRQQLDERGLTLANLCCDNAHVWNDSDEEAAMCGARARDCLKAARILGAQTVRIDMGIGTKQATDQQIDSCAKKFDEYCAEADTFGAKLGTENHWGASTSIDVVNKLFQAVKAKNFALLLHLGNWQCETLEEKCACDVSMAPRAMHMHMHYEACMNADIQFPPLVEAGYKGVWSIESHKSTNEYNNVAFQLAQARRVIEPLQYKMKRPATMSDESRIMKNKPRD